MVQRILSEHQSAFTTLTTTATLTLALTIGAPAANTAIHVVRITRSHHVSQSNDPVITLFSGSTVKWRAKSQTPLQEVYDFYHPLELPRGIAATVTMTSSLATHTLTAKIHYFLEE